MRVGNFFVLGSCIVAIAMAVACTQRTSAAPSAGDDDDDSAEQDSTSAPKKKKTTEPTQAEVDNSCLGKAKLAFDKASCTTCMSDSQDCCQATIKCFNDDKECSALQACMSKCGGDTSTPGASTQTPQAAFAKVYTSLQPSCGSCHLAGTSGAPIFFGADAESTRSLFKTKGYDKANSILVTKGQHAGPPLTADQKSLVSAWQGAEAAPPATGPGSGTGTGGGGGGGGGGTGGGTGMGTHDGGADGGASAAVVACQTQCKTDHAAGVPSWQAYNNCSTVLCKADCQ